MEELVKLAPHIGPAVIWHVLGLMGAVAMILQLLTIIVNRFTALRRAIRRARVTARAEGWGAPRPDDAELAEHLARAESGQLQTTDQRARTR